MRVGSSHTFIVKAEIDAATGELVVTFSSRGTSELEIYITDATGNEFRRPITVTNTTLPELNIFLGLIFIAAQRRRKKREQAEVEALLVSEMRLEDQMLKLAEAQTPDSSLPQGQLDLGVPPPMGLPTGEDDDSFDDSI